MAGASIIAGNYSQKAQGTILVGAAVSGALVQSGVLGPQLNTLNRIHIQHGNGRPPFRCQTHDQRASQGKVLSPDLLPWIEQGNETVRLRIKTGDIRSLECIAPVAGERQVGNVVATPMLLRNDVLYDKRGMVNVRLLQAAILATIRGSCANKLPPAASILALTHATCRQNLSSLSLQDSNEVDDFHVVQILVKLGR